MKNIVLINSKIETSPSRFTYAQKRSIYSSEERFEQTKNTILSIKKYIPNCHIILIDNSVLEKYMHCYFENEVDLFINPIDDLVLNHDTNINPTKAVGELAHIKCALEYIDNLDFEWGNLYKICGRYILNPSFNYQYFNNDKNIFRRNHALTDFKQREINQKALYDSMVCFFTSFYKISRRNYDQFKSAIINSYYLFKSDRRYANEPIELVLLQYD